MPATVTRRRRPTNRWTGRPCPSKLAALLPFRLALAFIATFVVLGTWLPYWQLWLQDHGCTEREIGWLTATTVAIRVLATPLILQHAELRARRRRTLIWFALVAAALMLPMPVATGFGMLLLLHAALGVFHPPQIPLIDAMTVRTAIVDPRVRYARVRLYGSIAFLLTALVVGELVRRFTIELAWWIIIGGFVATAIAGALLPDVDSETDAPDPVTERSVSPLRVLLRRRDFLLVLIASGLIQGSHAPYYAYASVHWRAAGLDERTIGLLWSEGVAAEILLFAFGTRLAERLGASRLFLIGAGAAIVRWIVIGSTTELALLLPFNVLHGLSFGATHLGAMLWIQRHIPRRQAASAQGLLSAISTGLAMAAATVLASVLYPAYGPLPTFGVMIVVALGGAVAAWRLNARRSSA